MLEVLSELTGTTVVFQDILESISAAEEQRRAHARTRIAAPRRGAPQPRCPEGEWSLPDQLAELPEYEL